MSSVTYQMTGVRCQVSHIRCHMSHVTHEPQRTNELTFWEKVHLLPPVICHLLFVMCHVSHVTNFYFLIFFFFSQCVEASRWRVSYQQGLPLNFFSSIWVQCTHSSYNANASMKLFSYNLSTFLYNWVGIIRIIECSSMWNIADNFFLMKLNRC